ncbi:hypothetical protein [Aeromicrobium sp. 179-A 4D2 NHS]|uniref:hypothetical protein n=1 Tax=Aeromicrobium sp. 179-A 4D2 NHS TaxID=3142375 RepID=UPI0039A191F1
MSTKTRTTINATKGIQGFHEVPKTEASGLPAGDTSFDMISNEDIRALLNVATNHAKRRFVALGKPDPQAAEDIAQQAIEKFLGQVANRPALMHENPKGYITTTVTHMVSAETSPVSKAARAGFVALSKVVSEEAQRKGADLTREEYETLAQKVLDEWPADRPKPPKDFWKQTRQTFLTDWTEYEAADLTPAFGQQSYTAAPDDSDIGMGQWSKALLEVSGNSADTTLIKYNAFAEHFGIAPVVPASIVRRTEVVVRKAVNAHICEVGGFDNIKQASDAEASEGLATILQDVADGKDHPVADAVFMPWNRASSAAVDRQSIKSVPLPAEERREVAKALLKHPEQAYPLWRSALLMADKTNYDRVLGVFSKINAQAS